MSCLGEGEKRRALVFPPDWSDYKTLPVDEFQQDLDELVWMLERLDGCRSVLEIGSYAGNVLQAMAMVCGRGAKIRSIDISDEMGLTAKIKELCEHNYDAACLIADSRSPEAVKWAKDNGPYDFVFIDGDHTYAGAVCDWNNYGGLAPLVGFHDIAIAGNGFQVWYLWDQLQRKYKTEQKVMTPWYMGIGLVRKNGVR